MTRFVLYVDEDSQDRDLVSALTQAGISVIPCRDAGMNGRTDIDQLALAAREGWVLYTSNARDFAVLHRRYMETNLSHAGILVRNGRRWSIGEQARRLVRVWDTLSAEEMVNRSESLSQWGEDRTR